MKRSIVQGRQLQLHKNTFFFKIEIAAGYQILVE